MRCKGRCRSTIPGNQDIEHGANQQRPDDADGHVALRILGLLRGGADGVKADVGKEDDSRAAHDTGPAELPRVPRLAGINGCQLAGLIGAHGAGDEEQHDGDFDEDDDVVEVGGFLDADDQQRGDQKATMITAGRLKIAVTCGRAPGSVPSALN